MANVNDFIWTDSEISKMIQCFDSDRDGKVCLLFLNETTFFKKKHVA
jgi:Ca2+-binding EF-hand superfamily protein